MLNRIWNLLRDIDEFILSIPWLLCWPVHVWNWAAHAEHVPMKDRDPLLSQSFGILLTLTLGMMAFCFYPEFSTFVIFLTLYMGVGIQQVCEGIKLSQKYRPTTVVRPEQATAS